MKYNSFRDTNLLEVEDQLNHLKKLEAKKRFYDALHQ